MSLRRNSDCLVIQPSDMIVIDYPDYQKIHIHHQPSAISSYSHSSQYSHLAKLQATNNFYEPTTSTSNKFISNNVSNSIGLTISATVRRPFYNRVPSPAPSFVTTDGISTDNLQNSHYVAEVKNLNFVDLINIRFFVYLL